MLKPQITRLRDRITEWYRGECVPPPPNDSSLVFLHVHCQKGLSRASHWGKLTASIPRGLDQHPFSEKLFRVFLKSAPVPHINRSYSGWCRIAAEAAHWRDVGVSFRGVCFAAGFVFWG